MDSPRLSSDAISSCLDPITTLINPPQIRIKDRDSGHSRQKIGAIQVLCNADGGGGGGVKFSGKKHYEGVRFNVISVTRGWVGVQIPGKKRNVTLEWPHMFEFQTCHSTGVTV